MNYKCYYMIIDIINRIMIFLFTYTIIGILIILSTASSSLAIIALCLLPASIISYFIDKNTNHIWTFMILHVIMAAFYFFITGNLSIRVIYCIYLFLLTIITFVQRLKEEVGQKNNTSIVCLGVLLIMYLVSIYLKYSSFSKLCFVFAILFILLYFLNKYLINYESFFRHHEEITNIPIHQVTSTSNTLILFFTAFCFGVMLVISRLPIWGFLSYIGNFLISIIKNIIIYFKPTEQSEIQNNIKTNKVIMDLSAYDVDVSSFMKFFHKIVTSILTFVVFTALIVILIYVIYKLYHSFYKLKDNHFKDKIEFISPFEKREIMKPLSVRTNKKWVHSPLGQTNSEKIRKYYYKAVTKHATNTEQLKTLTPSQLSNYALIKEDDLHYNSNDTEKSKQLTYLYEKARYSNLNCNKDEVQTVKDILK